MNMESKNILTSSHSDLINNFFESLQNCILKYSEDVKLHAAELLVGDNIDESELYQDLLKNIKQFIPRIKKLEEEWGEIINSIIKADYKEVNNQNIYDVTDNKDVLNNAPIKYTIHGDEIKIETKRPEGGYYSNVFSVDIFKEIVTMTFDIASKNGFVKTSDVADLLSEKIIRSTSYKKSPRTPVYSTFKLLVNENKLNVDENNAHKYILADKLFNLQNWIKHLT